ncbi:helix-turn-helix domain-containing protein [Pseudomonas xantholysinigenes]|uniref:Helix-turn-helix domain-containing protein n=1 Tax=Pseudomonas xantholysinigenes TaxID=2745490 RepID=A0A9E6TZL0_9PSED|nr:helix-turn-helix transcriptional regulator [Pseudomonas xantholysinigenes]QXI40419.1 helix-turn-helix domain-containing protein [Pseudomonas xantholysinigenes]
MSQKKRELEQWERDECAALKEAIADWNRARPKNERITQEQAGEFLGMNQGSFSNYLNGRTALNFEFALKVKNLFGIPVEAYSSRLASEIKEKYEILEGNLRKKSESSFSAIARAVPSSAPTTQVTFLDLNRFFESCEEDGYSKRRAVVRNARNHAVHGIHDEDRLARLYRLFYSIASAEIDGNLTDHDLVMMDYVLTSIDARYEQNEELRNQEPQNI